MGYRTTTSVETLVAQLDRIDKQQPQTLEEALNLSMELTEVIEGLCSKFRYERDTTVIPHIERGHRISNRLFQDLARVWDL